MTSLENVRAALIAEVQAKDRVQLVCARLILRTGINLQNIDPAESRNRERIAAALFALREMGFKLAADGGR